MSQEQLVECRRVLVECRFEIWVDYHDYDIDLVFDIEENHCPGTGNVGAALDRCMEEHEEASTCWACALNGSNKILKVESYMGTPRYKCRDCLGNGFGPMVHRDIWSAYGCGDGLLCQGCLEKRMGRPLADSDRSQPWWPDHEESEQAQEEYEEIECPNVDYTYDEEHPPNCETCNGTGKLYRRKA